VPSRELPRISDAATLVVTRRPARPRVRPVAWAALALVAVAGALVAAGRIGAREPAEAPPIVVAPPPRPDAAPSTPIPDSGAAATLRILTIPASAEIRLDGDSVGTGAVFDHVLSPGSRRIVARASGYADFDTTVTVVAGDLVNLGRVFLRPRTGRP
jgi:hypothetical protein